MAAQERDHVAGSAKNHLADVGQFPAQLAVSAHGFDTGLPSLATLPGARGVSGHAVGSGTFPRGDFHVEGPDAPLPPELFDAQADRCELPRGPYNPVDAGNDVVRDAP